MKLCNTCNIEKDETSFHFRDRNSTCKKPFCIECERKKDKIRRQSESYKKRVKGYYRDPESNKIRCKKYRELNPDKIRKSIKEWKENNVEKTKSYKLKYKQSSKSKMTESVRLRIKKYLLIKNITKKNTTFAIIGCTPNELKIHLESQFTTGMSWDNYGLYGWHIDHKVPLSSAKSEEELLNLCHFSNLQPLWAKDNLKKGSSKV
jgi:hypothetical protein